MMVEMIVGGDEGVGRSREVEVMIEVVMNGKQFGD